MAEENTPKKGGSGALKIVLIVVGVGAVLLVGAIIVVAAIILPPSSKKVCAKTRELMIDYLVDGGMSKDEASDYYDDELGGDKDCMDSADEEMKDPAANGGLVYIKEERMCIMNADTLDDALTCIDEIDSEK
ncbi:hypothetical protein JW887_01800 [Candidatus Dojkabacteria bacterium]|nr:hypothetical protein [Candidatus Dojkabacteria bacterium]